MKQLNLKGKVENVDIVEGRARVGTTVSGNMEPVTLTASQRTETPERPRKAERSPSGNLTESDLQAVQKLLHEDQPQVARRTDLANLHKKLVESLGVLGTGVGEQLDRQSELGRTQIMKRFDAIEKSMNSIEAILRIQLPPDIRSAINEAVSSIPRRRRSSWRWVFPLALGVVIGIGLGVPFSEEISAHASAYFQMLRGIAGV